MQFDSIGNISIHASLFTSKNLLLKVGKLKNRFHVTLQGLSWKNNCLRSFVHEEDIIEKSLILTSKIVSTHFSLDIF